MKFIDSAKIFFKKNPQPMRIKNDGSIFSSIAIIISENTDGDDEMFFIKRAIRNNDHFSGHMAFPGGVKEDYDKTLLDTAIRETMEEVGIDLTKSTEYLGSFDDYKPVNPAANKFLVSPHIFHLKNIKTKLKINPSEVEDTVWIPLKILKAMVKGSPRETVKFDKNYKDYVFRYKGYKIWGMTGKILYYFLNNIK
tara:strand:- start:820 stop:1404 length:585 start_codon:yes stop_codon:yes gene_type:complete